MINRATRVSKIAGLLAAVAFIISGLSASGVYATPDLLKEAKKEFGAEVKNCAYCHSGMPKKDNVSFNERGDWLVAQKKKRNADKIDVSWLKEYKK